MTLPIGNRTDATGNNSTADYNYTFRILAEAHLLVTVRDPDTDEETELTLTTDYTVDGVGDVGGGQITLVDSGQDWLDDNGYLDLNWVITIRGVEPLAQGTDIRNQGDYYPEGIEDAFDYQMRVAQQQQDEIDRSVRLSETVDPSSVSTKLPVPAAGTVLGWNDTADEIENKTPNSDTYLTKASTAEAQAGSEDTHYMTPAKTKNAIDSQVPTLINANKVRVVTGTISANLLATDASLCDVVNVSADANFALSNPTNGEDGQRITWRFTQDGTGSRILTLGSNFFITSEIGTAIVLSTAAGAIDHLGAIYDSTSGKWRIEAFATAIVVAA